LPTPIEHLVLANEILTSPDFPQALRAQLDAGEMVRGAFFFGHIAPDVRVISRQFRRVTHFFPPTNHHPAHAHMLEAHPKLARPGDLPLTQAVFTAGYLAHLLFDELWAREIFLPVFGPGQSWGERAERSLLHNVLRAWLDRRDWPRLPGDLGHVLRQVRPQGWLPFVADADLYRWRDLVADQFVSEGAIRTLEIFADHARISNGDFAALLEPDVMEARVFSRISLAALDEFHARASVRCRDLIVRYLAE
jgi:hypothetical protein